MARHDVVAVILTILVMLSICLGMTAFRLQEQLSTRNQELKRANKTIDQLSECKLNRIYSQHLRIKGQSNMNLLNTTLNGWTTLIVETNIDAIIAYSGRYPVELWVTENPAPIFQGRPMYWFQGHDGLVTIIATHEFQFELYNFNSRDLPVTVQLWTVPYDCLHD